MKVEFVTKEEADKIRRTMPKSKTMLEYEEYLQQLPEGQVGKIEVTQKDGIKPQTVRNRVNRASKNLELDIKTKHVGNIVLFWINKD